MEDKHIGSRELLYGGGREIFGLQILKFLCALMVVQIHFDSGVREFLLPLTRVAVPVFFMITGYFLPDASGRIGIARIKRMLGKVLKLELVACCVYLIFRFISAYIKGEAYPDLLSANYWAHVIVTGDEPRAHLWYMVALLQALVIMLVCVRLNVWRWIYWLIPVGLVLNLLFGSYNFLVDDKVFINNIFLSRNVLTVALPCLLIGTLIRYYEYKLPGRKVIMAVAAVGFVGIYVETEIIDALFSNKLGDIVIMTIPFSTAVFVLFLRMSVKGKVGKRVAYWGKAYSLDIYLWHIVIGSVFLYALKATGLYKSVSFDVVIAIAVTLFGVVLLRKRGITKNLLWGYKFWQHRRKT